MHEIIIYCTAYVTAVNKCHSRLKPHSSHVTDCFYYPPRQLVAIGTTVIPGWYRTSVVTQSEYNNTLVISKPGHIYTNNKSSGTLYLSRYILSLHSFENNICWDELDRATSREIPAHARSARSRTGPSCWP